MDTVMPFEPSEHPEFARLIDYWRGLAEPGRLPRAEDFRPGDVRGAIGWISLIDVIDGGADFRFRVFGSVCQSVFGMDLTCLRLSEVEQTGVLAGLSAEYHAVVNHRRSLFRSGLLTWTNGPILSFGRLLLPFVDRNDNVSRILSATDCTIPAEDVIMCRGLGIPVVTFDDPVRRAEPFASAYAV